jgi:hypothetical protein
VLRRPVEPAPGLRTFSESVGMSQRCHFRTDASQRIRSLFNQLAVLAGVFASLIVQILLTMLGFGIGLLAIDVPTASSAPASAGWAALLWVGGVRHHCCVYRWRRHGGQLARSDGSWPRRACVGGLVGYDRRRSGSALLPASATSIASKADEDIGMI